ncbi:Extracellular solute-binding protein family 3 [Pseudomonas reidholzensis]|uniref:Extracellular solute-binding protein family 3 n=1 Tax=Pseudomonas reidholzensis TaxID=1785162 RepID=A0A383RXF6_9PSED|nr:transporter substrate-binding domain-containing protein [Pseudomonas reidholzensis]SYX91166.1 Extracellular solute-binding protein family 3 [Pseudomonas reidholzensis]
MTPLPRLKAFSALLLFALSWLAVPAWAEQGVEIRIGAAHFPPYTVRPEQGAERGLLAQLAEALNALQQDYRFVLVPTSIPRRFGDFQQGRTDMAIFENPQWGWQQIPHQAVDMGLEDAEIFVARQQPGRDQHYFDELRGKRLALFNGYHYAFAHFNSDPRQLVETYSATLTYSHDSNLFMVQRGRAEIALVTRSFFSDFLVRNPGSRDQLMASERVDQVYHHYALLRPGAPISGATFASLLRRLRDNGELLRIFTPYRISVAAPGD